MDNMAIQKLFNQYSNLYKGSESFLEKIDEYIKKLSLPRIKGTGSDYEWVYDNKQNF